MKLPVDELLVYLKKQEGLRGISLRREYSNRIKGEPLSGPVVTVGLASLRITQAFLGGDAPREAEFTLRLCIYAPFETSSGAGCGELLETILPLLHAQDRFPFTRFDFDGVRTDRTAGAFVQELRAVYTDYITGGLT